jgi:8-oxo-dGTP pyrophosphatase MutT (NUDIX family)
LTDESPGLPVPGWLIEHAAKFAESGRTPVTPKLAATVILLRPRPAESGEAGSSEAGSRGAGSGGAGFEVYAVRRAATMAFAAGMYAFPGGSVDPTDSETVIDWTGPGPAEWAEQMSMPVGLAQAVVSAAVRELFEESGVLLAGRGADHVLGDLSAPDWETARTDLVDRRRSLTAWFAEAGLTLRADLLLPWSRWLTPEFEPRRYDTFFFLALLPEQQQPRELGGEADHTTWVAPGDALGLPMLPPTLHTLRELSRYSHIDALLAAAAGRDISAPFQPVLEVRGDQGFMTVKPS